MNGKISFSSDIRPLFTADDIAGMRPQGIDLAAVEDVRGHALRILARLAEKTMPPGRPWPDDQVERFRGWVAGGMAA